MSKILGAIAVTLVVGAFMATSVAPAGAADPGARYYVKIDNTGNGVDDVAHRWVTATSAVAANGKSYIGPADDPFFVDLSPVFDGFTM